MLRDIRLHGALVMQTGVHTLRLDVDTPRMLIRGLILQIPTFEMAMRESATEIAIVALNRQQEDGKWYGNDNLSDGFGDNTEIHIAPVVEGSIATISAYLIAEGWAAWAAYTAAVIVTIGANYALASIVQSLAPKPDTTAGAQRVDQRPSFIFNGPVNVVEQGYPVPLVYGEHLMGSIVISADIDIVELP